MPTFGPPTLRSKSDAELIAQLTAQAPWQLCSLIHKCGDKKGADTDVSDDIEEVRQALSRDFRATGNVYVFGDECHRSQSGDLHRALRAILLDAMFIGFTGAPLRKENKRTSIKMFGPYFHIRSAQRRKCWPRVTAPACVLPR